jgi:hypothetical protein
VGPVQLIVSLAFRQIRGESCIAYSSVMVIVMLIEDGSSRYRGYAYLCMMH